LVSVINATFTARLPAAKIKNNANYLRPIY
jgi:hypothetical protein